MQERFQWKPVANKTPEKLSFGAARKGRIFRNFTLCFLARRDGFSFHLPTHGNAVSESLNVSSSFHTDP